MLKEIRDTGILEKLYSQYYRKSNWLLLFFSFSSSHKPRSWAGFIILFKDEEIKA